MSDGDLPAMQRALVNARAARGWRRLGWPERSNKHVRDMIDDLAAAAGKADWEIDESEVVAEVERLEGTPHADREGGVHSSTVAETLGRSEDAMRRVVARLVEEGALVKRWDIGPRGPRQSCHIPDGGEGEAAGDAPAEESGPRRRRWVG